MTTYDKTQGTLLNSGSISLSDSVPRNTITFNNSSRKVMEITPDGDVNWYGKPSEGAEVLRTVFQNMIDSRISIGVRRRTYLNACKSILARAKTMTHEELIAFLEESVQNRESRTVLAALREADDIERN